MSHMCNDKRLFTEMVHVKEPKNVTLGNGHKLNTVGHATVMLDIEPSPRKFRKCKLSYVLCVPDLTFNLIRVAKTSDKIDCTVFTVKGCEFLDAVWKAEVTGRKAGGLYYLNCKKKQQSAAGTQKSDVSQELLWHRRYRHLGTQNIKKLVEEGMGTGLNCKMIQKVRLYEPCAVGKQYRTKFPGG